ncbi:MAG: toxin VasX [Pseudomonas sp.]
MTYNPRKDPNLAAAAESKSDVLGYGMCPLRQLKVQLLPLRYGLVERADPSTELTLPYALKSRPLGVRLLRDGWLYIIDSATRELHEYRVLEGVISALLWQGAEVSSDQREPQSAEPALVFARSSTLHVSFADVQWTAAQCNRMLNSADERAHFMQSVVLANVNCETGGKDLLTLQQTERWLAELAEDDALLPDADLPAKERMPYLWETPKRFREAHVGELLKRVLPLYQHDTLCLVVHDDIGVLTDLANYQDAVVGWIEGWAEGGAQKNANERDYLLACYIESLTLLNDSNLTGLANASDDPAIKAMLQDLDDLPSPQRNHAGRALLDHLNNSGQAVSSQKADPPEALLEQRQEALDQFRKEQGFFGSLALGSIKVVILQDVDWRYHTRQFMRPAPDDFVERHLKALVQLGKEQNQRIKDVLAGAKIGQRGVNELIDRAAMDHVLAEHRANLARWNPLLDLISEDRVALVAADRFHRAAWYFDAQQAAQQLAAFSVEYACLKDICRSDTSSQAMLEWLEKNPQFSLPLLHTLPLGEQSHLTTQYATLVNVGYALLNNLPHWISEWQRITQGRLPALDQLPDNVRVVAEGARDTLAPALSRGMERIQSAFIQGIQREQMPDLDQLFRNLPKALPGRILEAAKREGATFTFATPAEQTALQNDLKEVLEQRRQLKRVTHDRNQIIRRWDHKEPEAKRLQTEIYQIRGTLDTIEARLAKAISPIPELPHESVRLYGAAQGKAGVTLLFPPAQQRELGHLMGNVRQGIQTAPKLNVLGDGVGVLLFVAQMVNLVVVGREAKAQTWEGEAFRSFVVALTATATSGFTAVRGIFDTALTARAAALASVFQRHALNGVHVQLGKMHVGLGVLGSFFGVLATAASLNSHHSNWQQAVRSGNRTLQHSATLAMVGAAGQLASHSYDLGHVGYSAYKVFIARDSAARTAAWAAAGVRMSTVFFRVNLVGAMSTILELGGTWLYNRHNTSPHDQWLESTPWSLDGNKRQFLSLGEYQRKLTGLLQAPQVQVGPKLHSDRWQDMLRQARRGSIHLTLPGLSLAHLRTPLSGTPSHRLSIAAYRIITAQWDRGFDSDQWAIVSERVIASLRVVQSTPLILQLDYPDEWERPSTVAKAALILAVAVHTYNGEGEAQTHLYHLRLDPNGEGVFPVAPFEPRYDTAKLFTVDPLTLEGADE